MGSRVVSTLSELETKANRFFVLATYRHLLRATRIAFRGDSETLLASRAYARKSFQQNKNLDVGGAYAAQGLEHAQGVTQILKENVVQGVDKGNDLYRLNIHEHTQRLDNETATSLKGTTKTFKEIKGATF